MFHLDPKGFLATAVFAVVIACSSQSSAPATTGADSGASSDAGRERLYVGTGEYSPADTWDSVLRFEDAHLLNHQGGGNVTPDGTMPVKQMATGDSAKRLNFAHTFYVHEKQNEMFIGSLFTVDDGGTKLPDGGALGPMAVSGSIGVMANASTATGAQTLARHLWGSLTKINQPHGVWVDESRDFLYAANTFSGNVLVWTDAGTVNGNAAPARAITHNKIGSPVFVYIDAPSDRMFLACMNTSVDAGTQPLPAIAIYNTASTLNGFVEPAARIVGANTRLAAGNNQTTHNVWYDSTKNMIIVGHHTNEVLFFSTVGVNLSPSQPTDYDLTPRVLTVHERADDSDIYKWSTYGLFYVADKDRLYVATGYQDGGTASNSGGPPATGTPPNAVKVYDGVSDAGFSGRVPPNRVISWSNGATYYPPQALWVTRY